MQVILQGSLRHFPPGELLPFVSRRTESGTLDLETTGRRTRILFKEEKIVWAESDRGTAGADAVLDACEWTAGTFTLLDAASMPEGATPLALELAPLLEESKRRAAAAALYTDATLFRVVDDPALQQQVSLTGDEFKILFRLGSGRSFKDLVAELGVPRKELTERLQHLAQIGLISVVREQPPTQEAVPTAPQKKTTMSKKRPLVGSLTPDSAPDTVWPLLDSEYTIGRAPDNAITISDGSVSSNHACIRRTDAGFMLEDLQSRNGTFVNGEKLTEKRLLADGDLIRLGKIIMTFNIAREAKPGDNTQPEVRLG
jgi:pSer/pThr/pTyr-binding forkhead associated (FHA) protein